MTGLRTALALVLVISGTPVQADQAHARLGGPGGQEGQVILFRDGGACFGLTPLHVMDAALGMGASLIRRERVVRDGFAGEALDLGHDLALVSVSGAVAAQCGPPLRDQGDPRARIEAAGGRLVMRHVTAAGATLFRPVRLLYIGETHLFFEEAGEGATAWAVAPGDSGSALMLGDEIVGMVQERGAVNEPPRALLWSYALHLADWRLQRRAPQQDAPTAPALPAADGLRVERTTTRAHSPDHGADRLTAPTGDGGYWQAEAVGWPVEIDLALPAIRGVAGIILHPAPAQAQGRPRTVELFTTRTEEGDGGWTPFGTFILSLDPEPRVIALGAGQRLRRIRVSVHDTWSPGGEVALGRIEVRLAD